MDTKTCQTTCCCRDPPTRPTHQVDDAVEYVEGPEQVERRLEPDREDEAQDGGRDEGADAGRARQRDDDGERHEHGRPHEAREARVQLPGALGERVEEGDEQVEQHGQVERDAAPQEHVAAEPEQQRVRCKHKAVVTDRITDITEGVKASTKQFALRSESFQIPKLHVHRTNAQKSLQPHVFTSKFLLPLHLRKHVLVTVEEVGDLGALVVALRRVVDARLGVRCDVLADLGDREHDLLHGAVVPHDLDLRRVFGVVLERHVAHVVGAGRFEQQRQVLVVLRQLMRQDVDVVADVARVGALVVVVIVELLLLLHALRLVVRLLRHVHLCDKGNEMRSSVF